jgi:hypothetical protein
LKSDDTEKCLENVNRLVAANEFDELNSSDRVSTRLAVSSVRLKPPVCSKEPESSNPELSVNRGVAVNGPIVSEKLSDCVNEADTENSKDFDSQAVGEKDNDIERLFVTVKGPFVRVRSAVSENSTVLEKVTDSLNQVEYEKPDE